MIGIDSGVHWDGLRVNMKGSFDAILRDLDEVQRELAPQAAADALNKAAELARTQSARRIAQLKDMPYGTIRSRFSLRKATKVGLTAQLRLRVTAVMAQDIGKPKQTRTGAKVRSHTFPGAFVQFSKWAQKDAVFKRVGRERYPIRFQNVPIEPVASNVTLAQVANVVAARWHELFTAALAYRLERKSAGR